MKTSVVYIVSNIDKALAFEWVASHLNQDIFNLSYILLNPGPSQLEDFLMEQGITTTRVTYTGKKDIPRALIQVIRVLQKTKADVVHCHLFDANVVGLLAGRFCGVKKAIYTRHHSSLHHVYFPRAVYYDQAINKLATHIVAISGKVKQILKEQEQVNPAKITLIPHGFKLEDFIYVPEFKVKALQSKYNPEGQYPVIGAISRYTHWKGLQFTIEAFKQVLYQYPDALLVLANASGDYKATIQSLLQDIPPRNYREISFESDIMALYKIFDVFVHVPIDDHSEAFGQTYVESLASGVPAIFTLSGIANEFIQDRKNALVVKHQTADTIREAILSLLSDTHLRASLIEQGRQDVLNQFNLDIFIKRLETLYLA